MVLHPPTLFIGYVGLAVPFAFAISTLILGRGDKLWVQRSQKWAVFGWLLPLARHRPRRLVGLRGAQLRRLLGLGRRREHLPGALAHGHGAAPLLHALQGSRPVQALGARPRRADVLLHHPRHLDHAHGPHQLGARLRQEPGADLDPLDVPGRDGRGQRRAHRLALAHLRESRRGRERPLARLPVLRHQPAAHAVRHRRRLRARSPSRCSWSARWGRAPTTRSPVLWASSSSP